MPVFLVERYVPRSAQEERLLRARGVRYVRSILLPDDETCFDVYEAPSATTLAAAHEEASVSFVRIAPAVLT